MDNLQSRICCISDLFFNHQHSHYQELFIPKKHKSQGNVIRLADSKPQQIETAIRKDAEDFLENFGVMIQQYVPEMDISATWLVKDFMSRL